MKRLCVFLGAMLLYSGPVLADLAKAPCTPMFLAGPQGRPLPNATVSVTDSDGVAVTGGIYNDPNGASLFPFTVSSQQILQFYVDTPGEYQVSVSAAGANKTYWTICGYGLREDARIISIDRPAETLNDSITSPPNSQPTYVPSTSGFPNTWTFVPDDVVTFDFIAPSFTTTFRSLLISMRSSISPACSVTWAVYMCRFADGNTTCDPLLGTTTTVSANIPMVALQRVDAEIDDWDDFTYSPDDHITVAIKMSGASTCSNGFLTNVRIEFDR